MFVKQENRDRRGNWPKALASLAISILLILGIRWALFEPYIIPSGSMVPTLLINDHILVNKFAYGLRLPFTQNWLMQFATPQRGEIIVFRAIDDPQMFLVKRVVGLPGDLIEYSERELKINGELIEQREADLTERAPFLIRQHNQQNLSLEHDFKIEKLGDFEHIILYWRPIVEAHGVGSDLKTLKVPEGHFFMLGDNRDHSSDSRIWGTIPFENVLGRASIIWLSCEKMAEGSSRLCDFSTIRTERLFSKVH